MILTVLVGNVTSDPNMAVTKAGKPVCNFTVACNPRKKLISGERPTFFVRVAAFDSLADICRQYVFKGKKVTVVTQDYRATQYQARDGSTKFQYECTADSVEFMMGTVDNIENAPPPMTAQKGHTEARASAEGFIPVTDEDLLPF